MSEDPYRETPPRPVCATCEHRADAKMQDPDEPWRDWLCLKSEHEWWPEEYNPLTGITTPAKRGWRRCREVNGDGACADYAPIADTVAPDSGPGEIEIAEGCDDDAGITVPDDTPVPKPLPLWRVWAIRRLGGEVA